MTAPTKGFFLVDIETTGLFDVRAEHADVESILEVGVALYSVDLEPVERFSTLIVTDRTPRILERLDTDPQYAFVKKMHTENGLIADLEQRIAEIGEANLPAGYDFYDQQLTAIATSWGLNRTEPMVGSSLRLDRNFLEFHGVAVAFAENRADMA